MRNRRLVRAAAVFSGLALILAACGDDDDEASTEDTTSGAEETTTTAAPDDGGGGDGALAGMRGTTPLPETTPEVEAFQDRMLEADPALEDFNYGPEAYDAVLEELRDADGLLSMPTREWLAAEAFALTARYDTAIARWVAGVDQRRSLPSSPPESRGVAVIQ